MAQVAHAKSERPAKAQMSNIITQEVSLVDMAANLRRFIAIKRGEMDPKTEAEEKEQQETSKAPEPPPAEVEPEEPPADDDKDGEATKALALPPQAQQTMLDGLADVLERLTGLAQLIGEAELDEAASVPAELPQMLADTGMMISGLAEQFAAASGEGESAPPVDGEAEKQAAEELAKQCCEVGKAGRKISGHRLKKLEGMAEELSKLIRDLGGAEAAEAAAKPTAKSAAGEPSAPTIDPAELVSQVAKAVMAELEPKLGEVAKAVATKAAEVDAEKTKAEESIAKAQAKVAELSAALRSPGSSNLGTDEPNGQRPGGGWPNDLAAAVAKRRRATDGVS